MVLLLSAMSLMMVMMFTMRSMQMSKTQCAPVKVKD